jgi:uncharacterized protein (DUF1684 family)
VARLTTAILLAMVAAACGKPAPVETADSYLTEIAKFREAREAVLKTDTGWLTIAGLFFLTKPETTFGSDPANDIVLPAGAPARAGTFSMHDGKVSVRAAGGISFVLNGNTITSADLKSDGAGTPDRIGLQDLTLWVHQSGDRLAIRLRDKNNHLRREFTGLNWYPVKPAYRVVADYLPYDTPRTMQIPNILGDIDTMVSPGTAAFEMDGQRMQMIAVADPDHPKELWFIFRDLTTGKETDPAARFLYTPLPENGKVALDFNRSQNPPCAYNAFATCPLPPQQNRMPVRVEAGEKIYEPRP